MLNLIALNFVLLYFIVSIPFGRGGAWKRVLRETCPIFLPKIQVNYIFNKLLNYRFFNIDKILKSKNENVKYKNK